MIHNLHVPTTPLATRHGSPGSKWQAVAAVLVLAAALGSESCRSRGATGAATPATPVDIGAGDTDPRVDSAGGATQEAADRRTVAPDDTVADRDPSALGLPIGRPVLTAASNDGAYWVVASPDPDEIVLNETFALDVWVYDGADHSRPVDDETRLAADADMPEHKHGMTRRAAVLAGGSGRFRVEGMRLHMPGHWQIYLDVIRRGITERAQFDIDIE